MGNHAYENSHRKEEMRIEYVIKRLFYCFLAFFVGISITFAILHLMPGDYISHLLINIESNISPEASEAFKHKFGLDKSLTEQYFIYINNLLYGDWGYSFEYGVPILNIVVEKLRWTLILLVPATLLSLLIGVFIGAYFGWKSGSKLDLSVLNVMIFIRAIPSYWWALMFVLIFGFYLGLFPLGGYMGIGVLESGTDYLDILHHSLLPMITLTLCSIPGNYYLMRNSMLLTVGEDYIITARGKGLSEKDILFKHTVKNAMLPMVTMITLELVFMISGSVFIETIFSWPGMGMLMIDAMNARDLPLLQGIFLMDTLLIIIANFTADMLYSCIDPRVKVGE